ncbi:hypothetical protein CSUI_003400 [Cystoisospora suis]|uniref:Uncharacterized protein n=1 Tax=Cystoisospora suis TaxID=483139 RepID=A0A2C6KQJ9_9APIC|nr:hypothetical protein CSUI_003400 [Cystoisospora suis]
MDRQTFLHRSGRAGRFGGEGFCVSISSEDEKPSFEYLASSFRISLHYSLHDLIHIQQQRQLQMKQIGDADEHGKANETAEEEAKEKEKEEEVKAKEEVKGDRCSMANEGNDERHEVPISLGEEDRTKGILSPIAGSSSSPSSEKHNLPESPSSSLVEGRCSSLEERNPSIPMPVGVKAHEGYRGDTRLNKTEEEEGERRTDRVGDRRGNQDRSLTNGREDKVREFPCVEGPSGEGAYENLLLSPSTQESFKETEVKTNLAEDVSMKDVSLHDERRPKIERDAEIEEKHSSEKAPERGGGVLDGKRRLGVSGEDHKEERKNKEDEDKKKKKKDRQERERKEDVRLHEREEEELREQEEEKKKMKNRQAVHEENSPSPLNYEDVSVLKIPLIGMFISHANLLHSLSSSSSSLCSSSPHLRRSYRQHQGSKEDVQGKNFHRETSLQEGPSFSPSRVSSTSPLLAGEKGDRKEIDNDEEEEEHPYAFFSSPLCSLEFSLLQTIRRDRRRSKERFVMKRKNLEEDTNDKEMRGMRAVASYEEEEGETERDSSGDENSPVSLSSSSFSPESDSMHMAHEESSRFSIKIAAAEQHPPTWSLFSPSSFLLTSPLALSPGLYSPSRKESSPWRFSSSSDTSSSFFTRAHAYRGRFSSPPPPPRVKEEEEDDALSSPTSSSFSSFSIAIRPREVLPVSEALEARRIQERGGREKSELVKEEEQSWSSLSFLLLSFISCEEEMRRGEDHEEDVQSIVRRGGVYTRMRIVRASSLKDLIQRKAIRETGRSSLRRRQPFQGEKRDVNEKKKGVTKVKGKGEEDEEEEKGMEKYMIFAYSKAYEDLMRDALKHIDATSSKQERDHRRLLSDEGRREEDRISEKKKKKGKGVEKDLVKQKNSWRSESTQSRLREGESAGECLGGEREEKIGEGEKATFTVKDNAEKKRDIDPPSREGDSSMEKEGRRHSSRETKDERKNEIKRCEVDQRRKEGRSKRVKRDDGMTSDDRHALWCIFEAACAVKGREEEEEETEERQRKFKAGSNRFAVNGRGAQQREKDKERERRDVHPMKEEDSGWSPTDKRKKNAKQEKKRKENDSESDGETEKEEAVIASVGSSPSSLSHRESRRRSEMKGTPSSVSSFTVKDESPGEGRGEREAYRALVQLKSMHTQFWKNLLVHRLSGRNNS